MFTVVFRPAALDKLDRDMVSVNIPAIPNKAEDLNPTAYYFGKIRQARIGFTCISFLSRERNLELLLLLSALVCLRKGSCAWLPKAGSLRACLSSWATSFSVSTWQSSKAGRLVRANCAGAHSRPLQCMHDGVLALHLMSSFNDARRSRLARLTAWLCHLMRRKGSPSMTLCSGVCLARAGVQLQSSTSHCIIITLLCIMLIMRICASHDCWSSPPDLSSQNGRGQSCVRAVCSRSLPIIALTCCCPCAASATCTSGCGRNPATARWTSQSRRAPLLGLAACSQTHFATLRSSCVMHGLLDRHVRPRVSGLMLSIGEALLPFSSSWSLLGCKSAVQSQACIELSSPASQHRDLMCSEVLLR